MLAVVLALSAAVSWGSADFLGGLLTRRANLWTVLLGAQLTGLCFAAVLVVAFGRPWIGFAALWPALAAGLIGGITITSFYKALAIGTMSLVAPITAMGTLVPFAWGIASGERPAALQLCGVLFAIGGVLLASMTSASGSPGDIVEAAVVGPAVMPDERAVALDAATTSERESSVQADHRLSIVLALVAAVGMGFILVGYAATAQHDPLWALLGARSVSSTFFVATVLVLRPRLAAGRGTIPGIVACGLLDTGANGLFAVATTLGFLSITSVISSVYPVTTVVLAYIVLRERLGPRRLAGVVMALAGVALIAAG